MINITAMQIAKLKKAGIPATDYKRVLNPLESTFHFIPNDVDVKIESAKDVLPPHVFRELMFLQERRSFKMNDCHVNSYIVALALGKYGVRISDGCYSPLISPHEKTAHSFLEYKGRYFDVTIEFASRMYSISDFKYHSFSIIEGKERHVINCALGYLLFHDLRAISCGSLCMNEQLQRKELSYSGCRETYMLDAQGKLQYYKMESLLIAA